MSINRESMKNIFLSGYLEGKDRFGNKNRNWHVVPWMFMAWQCGFDRGRLDVNLPLSEYDEIKAHHEKIFEEFYEKYGKDFT